MIIHVGTEVNILFGVLDDGNVVQKVPYKIELNDFSDESMKKLQEAVSQLKVELEKQLAATATDKKA